MSQKFSKLYKFTVDAFIKEAALKEFKKETQELHFHTTYNKIPFIQVTDLIGEKNHCCSRSYTYYMFIKYNQGKFTVGSAGSGVNKAQDKYLKTLQHKEITPEQLNRAVRRLAKLRDMGNFS